METLRANYRDFVLLISSRIVILIGIMTIMFTLSGPLALTKKVVDITLVGFIIMGLNLWNKKPFGHFPWEQKNILRRAEAAIPGYDPDCFGSKFKHIRKKVIKCTLAMFAFTELLSSFLVLFVVKELWPLFSWINICEVGLIFILLFIFRMDYGHWWPWSKLPYYFPFKSEAEYDQVLFDLRQTHSGVNHFSPLFSDD